MSYYPNLIITAVMAVVVVIIGGILLVPYLTKLKIKQTIRQEGPQSHLIKTGTPTMGGILIVIAILLASYAMQISGPYVKIMGLSMLGFGLLGFFDDFIKVVVKRNLGFRAYQKIIIQIIISVVIAMMYVKVAPNGTKIFIPIANSYLDLSILYVPFLALFMIAVTNSVNLTDGLDGLASKVTIIVAIFFSIAALRMGEISVAVFSAAIAGACLGFLKYNSYPAKIFMGDTGSMALGGALAGIAIALNLTLIFPIVGGIYLIEALSVIMQVISFKTRGVRIFKMSPIHHHFELSGWEETKVVRVFSLVTVGLCAIGLLIIFI